MKFQGREEEEDEERKIQGGRETKEEAVLAQ